MKKKIEELGPAWPSISLFTKKGIELLGSAQTIIISFMKREVKLLGSLGWLQNHVDEISVGSIRA